MISKKPTRVAKVLKKREPLHPLDQKPVRQHVQGPVQAVTPQVAYRRGQVNRKGLTPMDLLAIQRTVGNRQVQPMLERRVDNATNSRQRARVEEKHGIKMIQRELSKRDEKIKTSVEQLVKDGKHDEALDLICKEYGFTGKNFEIKVVPAMPDSWATTGGEIKAGAKQTLSIGKDLFDRDFTFVLRTIGHEFQHLKQRSQEKPIENQKEREFLAWGWEALDTSVPTYSLSVAADHAKTALEFYTAMPDERKELSSNKEQKKALEKLIKDAAAAAKPK